MRSFKQRELIFNLLVDKTSDVLDFSVTEAREQHGFDHLLIVDDAVLEEGLLHNIEGHIVLAELLFLCNDYIFLRFRTT